MNNRGVTVPIMLGDNATEPTYAHEGDAGLDVYLSEPVEIAAGETVVARTGVRVGLPVGTFGALFGRSGLSSHGIGLATGVSVIDSGYRGELLVPVRNATDHTVVLDRGARVAQLVVIPYATARLVRVDGLAETDRGEGGFGSTGVARG